MEIALIDMPTILLREVRTDSVEFAEMVRSIRTHGVLNSVLVRPRENGRFQLVDGAWRLTASKAAGKTEIDAIVRDLTDEEVLAIQIETNAVFADTTTMEYAKHLLRLQQAYPGLTIPKLAKLVSKSAFWVKQQMRLLELDEKIQPMVDRGEISLMNAYQLAKLPRHMQMRHLEAGLLQSPEEFKEFIASTIRNLMVESKERAEEKRLASINEEPHPYLRGLNDLKAELKTNRAAALLIADQRPQTHLEAFRLALQWVMHTDHRTLEERRGRVVERTFDELRES